MWPECMIVAGVVLKLKGSWRCNPSYRTVRMVVNLRNK